MRLAGCPVALDLPPVTGVAVVRVNRTRSDRLAREVRLNYVIEELAGQLALSVDLVRVEYRN